MAILGDPLKSSPQLPLPRRPAKVCLVITDLDVGGAERALVALALGLDRNRWAPSVVCLAGEGALAEVLRQSEIPVTCLGVNSKRPIAAVTALARVLRRERPSLIQSFLFHANIATRLSSLLVGRPPVLGGIRVAERQRRWHLTLDRLTARLTVGSVCVSNGVRRFSIDRGGLDPDRLVVIPNGVDLARFDSAEPVDHSTLGIPPGAILTLYVGRLDPQKGLDTLLDAAAIVSRASPDWHLALVGDGPLRTTLQAQATALPDLAGRVHWLGRRDDVPGLLRGADMLVLPSRWEGMPNVVLEAMAAGCPVVGSRVEGTEDLIIPESTGWLVPPDQVQPLAGALIEAAQDSERRRAFGRNGRLRVELEFTPARVVAAYDRLWAGILGQK